MAYNNGQIIGIGIDNYEQKSKITLDLACLKFTQFHADPNYVILSCKKGTILIFEPRANKIVAQFNLEDETEEEKSYGSDIS